MGKRLLVVALMAPMLFLSYPKPASAHVNFAFSFGFPFVGGVVASPGYPAYAPPVYAPAPVYAAPVYAPPPSVYVAPPVFTGGFYFRGPGFYHGQGFYRHGFHGHHW